MPVGGGCIHQTQCLVLSDGSKLFLKESKGGGKMFACETRGLLELKHAGGPTVPRIYAYHASSSTPYLLLEWFDTHPKTEIYWRNFGLLLARLHEVTASEYGFQEDNFIGTTPQLNAPASTWIEFYRDRRLGYQLGLLIKKGYGEGLISQIERLMDRLEKLLPEPDRPALLHGDLWGGNIMAGAGHSPVIFDPAIYYGHREADLAMTELFGSFHDVFYRTYMDTWPLDPGYEERRDIYNLYHLINHVILFGSSYLGQVKSIADRYG